MFATDNFRINDKHTYGAWSIKRAGTESVLVFYWGQNEEDSMREQNYKLGLLLFYI